MQAIVQLIIDKQEDAMDELQDCIKDDKAVKALYWTRFQMLEQGIDDIMEVLQDNLEEGMKEVEQFFD